MEDKIKIGEYVRDRDGLIIKVNEIQDYKEDDDIWYEQSTLNGTWRSITTKHSKNIIDLIEVGDFVNKCKVVEVLKDSIVIVGLYRNLKEDEIKSILTHEQYENICYKVVE